MIAGQYVWPLCVVGFAVFCIGVASGSYTMLRTGDWTTAALDKYSNNSENPGWPVWCVWFCVPPGIVIVFGAILAS